MAGRLLGTPSPSHCSQGREGPTSVSMSVYLQLPCPMPALRLLWGPSLASLSSYTPSWSLRDSSDKGP